ncbi:MAG: tyrosine-type recombinase/integrase [Hydrogenophaga sp.]|uniref:tyrosine-type recombinase/integrase n=1 Tax=Hydrogenophaga sp. TaxID=1904254 RepID=UPI0040371456
MGFDARAAKALQPGQHIIVDDAPGLRLVATATTRSWTYRYKSPIDERMRQQKLGQWPAMSYAAALGEWQKKKAERDAGVDPARAKAEARKAAPRRQRAGVYTVRNLVDDYLAGHVDVNRKAKGAAEVRRMFDKNLGRLSDRPAASVGRGEAFEFMEGLARTPVQAQYIKQELGAAWDYALDAARLPEDAPNWWRLIMRGKLRSKGRKIEGEHVGEGKRVLTPAETGELIRWLPNFTALVEDLLTLYLWTLTRGAESTAMEGREISIEGDVMWWTLPKAKTKNARIQDATDLRVPLIGRARIVVERRMKLYGNGYLFPSRVGGHVDQKVVGVAVWVAMPYCKQLAQRGRPRLPVTRWGAHDLRRTSRTLLAALGCPNEIGEAILGHVAPGVVGVYNLHQYDAERLVWLTRLDARLEELARAHA